MPSGSHALYSRSTLTVASIAACNLNPVQQSRLSGIQMKGCLVALGIFLGLPILGVRLLSAELLRYPCPLSPDGRSSGWRSGQDRIKRHRRCLQHTTGSDRQPRRPGYSSNTSRICTDRRPRGKGLLSWTFANAPSGPEYDDGRNRNQQISCPLDDIGCLPFAGYFQPGTDIGLSYSQQKAALHQLLRQSGPRDVPFVILPKLCDFEISRRRRWCVSHPTILLRALDRVSRSSKSSFN